ncbi:MAG: class I SAM-dependent methyltransferase [Deltaproteobacteria bacterium]
MYNAQQRYQDNEYAENYDKRRFFSLFGRLIHIIDMRALDAATTNLPKGSLILDVPCGTGRLTTHLANNGFRVAGVDISKEMIQIAKRKDYSGNLEEFMNSPAENLPYPDKHFDHVTSGRFLAHLPPESRVAVLKEFARVSKGEIIVGYHILNVFADISRYVRTCGQIKHFKLSRVHMVDALCEISDAGLQIIKTVKLIPVIHDYRYFILQHIK